MIKKLCIVLFALGSANSLAATYNCTMSPKNDAQTRRQCNLGAVKLYQNKTEAGLLIHGHEYLFSNSGEGAPYYAGYSKSFFQLGQYNLANVLMSPEILANQAGAIQFTFDYNDESSYEVQYDCKLQAAWL